jgi:hypothetical protein
MANIQSIITNGNGNVLINTTTDNGSKLNVNGSYYGTGNIALITAGYPLIDLGVSTSNYFRINFDNPNDRLLIGKNGASSFILNASGSAVFSSTISATKGQFSDASGAGSVLEVYNTVATNATTAIIRQTTAGGNGNQDIGLLVDIQGAGDTDRIANFRYYDGSTYTSRMAILRGGNVGIGTTAPLVKLRVQSSGSTFTTPDNNDVATISIYNSNNSSATAHAIISMRTQVSGGSPFISFDVENEAGYSVGMDNASNQFRIAYGWNSLTAHPGLVLTQATSPNVLIGTTTDAGYKLDVNGNTNVSGGTITAGAETTYAFRVLQGKPLTLGGDSNYAYIQSWSSGPLSINSQGNNVLFPNASTSVGIGTDNPATKLDITGTLGFTVGAASAIIRRTTVNGSNGIVIQGNANDTVSDTNPGASIFVGGGALTDTYEGNIVFTAYGEIVDANRNQIKFFNRSGVNTVAERMRINHLGNVGIGTTNPTGKLHIAQSNSGGVAAILLSEDESTIQGPAANTQIRMGSNLVLGASNIMTFGTNGSEKMRITSGGNVLIGTDTDNGRKLNVSGDIFSSGEIYSNQYAAGRYIRYNWNTTNFAVGASTATRWVIGRIYWNQVHWGNYSGMDIEIVWNYYNGARKKYSITNGAGGGGLYLRESQSYASAYGRITLGSAVDTGTTSGGYSNFYQDVYLDVTEYNQVSVNGELKGSKISIDKTSIGDSEYGWATFFSSPTSSSISLFTNQAATILSSEGNWGYIDNKLGINNSNPSGTLHVQFNAADGQNAVILRTQDGGGNGVIRWQNNGATNQAGIGSNYNVGDSGALEFLNGATTNMMLRGNGNLLIGTTTDSGYKLDVRSITTDPVAFFGFSQTASASNGLIKLNSGRIPQSGGDFSGESGIIFGHSGGTVGVNFDGQGGYIKSIRLNTYAASAQSDSALVFATSNDNVDAEIVRITNTGNVLINTTTDSGYKLDVNGGTAIRGDLTFDTTRTITSNAVGTFLLTNPADAGIIELNAGTTAAYKTKINVYGRGNGNGITFTTQDAERMRITDAGNVSIGNTNDIYKLDVRSTTAGNISVYGKMTAASGSGSFGIQGENTSTAGTAYGVGGYASGAATTNVAGIFSATGATNNYGLLVTNGNVGFGTTAPQQLLHVLGATNGYAMIQGASDSGQAGIYFKKEDTTGTMDRTKGLIVFHTNVGSGWGRGNLGFCLNSADSNAVVSVSDEKFRMVDNGDFLADGDVVAYSTTISDARYKTNIQPIESALDKVNQMRGVSFDWTAVRSGREFGVIAQEIEQIAPEVVSEKELLNGDTMKTVSYTSLVPFLIESIKELTQQVNELKAQLDGLTK